MNKNAIQICLSTLIADMQPAIAGDAYVDKSKATTDSASLLSVNRQRISDKASQGLVKR